MRPVQPLSRSRTGDPSSYTAVRLLVSLIDRQVNPSTTTLPTQALQSSISSTALPFGTLVASLTASFPAQGPSNVPGFSSNPQAASTPSASNSAGNPSLGTASASSSNFPLPTSPSTSPVAPSSRPSNSPVSSTTSVSPTVASSSSSTASPSPSVVASPSQVSTSNVSSTTWPQSWPTGYYATNIAANVANLSASSFMNGSKSFKSAFDIGLSTELNVASGQVELNYSAASSRLFPSFGPYNSSKLSISRVGVVSHKRTVIRADSNSECAVYLQTLAKSSNLASKVQSLFNSVSQLFLFVPCII